MDYLREGIHLRGFAQIEPIVAYKNEAFTLFQDLMHGIWSDFARLIYHVEVEVEAENGHGDAAPARSPAGNATNAAAFSYSGGTLDDQPSAYGGDAEGYGVDAEAPEPAQVVQQRRVDENDQLGRNDPCWCGSGKKYKKCHGA
jgi:preprotein translocase subunit SecA